MSHWIDSSSKFKWDCAHVGIRHIKEGSVVLKPLLWTNSSLVPSPGALLCSYILHSLSLQSLLGLSDEHFQLHPSRLRSIPRRVLIIFIALLTACDGALPFWRTKKKSACYLKTLQLVSLARLLLKYRPASQLLFNSVFQRGFKTRFTSKNSHCWEIPKSLRALDGTRPLVFDSPRSFHEQNEISSQC